MNTRIGVFVGAIIGLIVFSLVSFAVAPQYFVFPFPATFHGKIKDKGSNKDKDGGTSQKDGGVEYVQDPNHDLSSEKEPPLLGNGWFVGLLCVLAGGTIGAGITEFFKQFGKRVADRLADRLLNAGSTERQNDKTDQTNSNSNGVVENGSPDD